MKKFPFKIGKHSNIFLICTIVISTLLTIALGIHSENILDKSLENSVHTQKYSKYATDILFYDEVLTSSALLAATTLEPQWEKYYRMYEPKLDNAIKEIFKIDTASIFTKKIDYVNEANIQLVAIENKVFELVRDKKQAEAIALINSRLYKDHKKIYATELSSIIKLHEQKTVSHQAAIQAEAFRNKWYFGAVILSLTMIWLPIERSLRTSHNNLIDSNNRFNLIAKATNDCIYDWDLISNTAWWGDGITTLFGYAAEDVENTLEWFLDKVHPDDRNDVAGSLEQAIAAGLKNWISEYKFRHRDGSYHVVQDRAFLLFDESGNPIRFVGSMLDITASKLAAEKINLINLQLNLLVENSPLIVYTCNAFGNFDATYISENIKKQLGYDTKEFLEIPGFWANNIHPDDKEVVFNGISKLFEIGEYQHSYKFKHKNGTWRCMSDSLKLVYDENNSPKEIIGYWMDITEKRKAEIEIKNSEIRFRTLYESITDALFLVDNGIFINCNAITPKIFGCEREDIIGHSPIEFSPEKQKDGRLSSEKAMEKINAALNGIPQNFEWTHCHLDGSLFEAEVSLSRIELDNKVFMRAIVKDISERKRAEEALKIFAQAIKSSKDCIGLSDVDLNISFVNEAVLELYGYSEEEIIGQNFEMLLPKNCSPGLIAEIKQEIIQYGTWQNEIIQRKKDGTEFSISVCVSPVFDEHSNIISVIGIARDITEEKKAKEAIKIFAQAIKSSKDCIGLTDANYQIKFVNEAALEMFGYSEEELIGQNVEILLSKKSLTGLIDVIKQATIEQGTWQNELTAIKKDGTEFPIFLSTSQVLNEHSNIISFIGIARDITEEKKAKETIKNINKILEQKVKDKTKQLSLINKNLTQEIEERKQAETTLVNAKYELEQSIADKSDFFSRVSHELRTPLNGILGFAQLLNMGELDSVQKKGVSQILKSGNHLLSLVNEVLELARPEIYEFTVSLEPVYLKGIFSDAVSISQPFADKNNITIETENLGDENSYVLADYQKLTRVLLNILNNAIKYNKKEGLVTIKATNIDNLKVRISITDTGNGIPKKELSNLFRPFLRIGKDISEIEGTGLGLAVAKKLTEAMKGTIGAESEMGKGSTFWIELLKVEGQLERHQRETNVGVNGSKTKTMLYIESNISNQKSINHIINNLRPDIKLITSLYGKNILKLAMDYKPNVIMIDLDKSNIDGSETIKLLKNDPLTKKIPVIIFSAKDNDKQVKKMLKSGAKAYLTKPLNLMEFLKTLDEMMGIE